MPDITLCVKCGLVLTEEVISLCTKNCPNKEQSNTSGKVHQLFTISGNGFEVDGVNYLSGEGTP